MTCKQCKYIDRCMSEASFLGQVFDPNYDGEHGCREFDTFTNADRIRAMGDEELAELLLNACIGSKCGEQPTNEHGSIDCFACRLKWLKQPADQDDDEDERLPRIGRWVFWNGWVSNHDLRIEDAFCSECGYRHPTVRLDEGYLTVEEARAAALDKLAKECPNCGAKMIGGWDNA